MSFDAKLELGGFGEDAISRFFISRSTHVVPAYQLQVEHGKGPRLFGPDGSLICPDLLVINGRRVMWAEAKTKSAFTYHRKTGTWQTGIDLRHWLDYLKVEQATPFPVWLFFLHQPGRLAKDTPEGFESPSGLYGDPLSKLVALVDHESERHGPSGMVYWREESLTKWATCEALAALIRQSPRVISHASAAV